MTQLVYTLLSFTCSVAERCNFALGRSIAVASTVGLLETASHRCEVTDAWNYAHESTNTRHVQKAMHPPAPLLYGRE